MLFAYLTLTTALIISITAAVYSILGLTAIFAAAFWPIVIMGGSLEVGKIVTTLWLHKYWDRAELRYKLYLCSAVAILMLLTSMGVFGFLSKAHLDQSVPTGDVAAKVAIYDEKIKTERDNIEAARRSLQQMDSQVDARLSRGDSEQSAERAVQIRRSQAKERAVLQKEIIDAQNKISKLNEERAPIASELRKVEAEVGPIKYIAAMVYGDNPDANLLEKAVRWVIILIVIVFDPLALTLLLAATKSIEWERGINIFNINNKKRDEEDDKEDDKESIKEDQEIIDLFEGKDNPDDEVKKWFDHARERSQFWDQQENHKESTETEIVNSEPSAPGWMFTAPTSDITSTKHFGKSVEEVIPVENFVEETVSEPVENSESTTLVEDVDPIADMAKIIMSSENSNSTPAEKESLIESLPISDSERKRLKEMSSLSLQPDNVPAPSGNVTGFGISFPNDPVRGDMFLRVDQLPTQLYKFNGAQWIAVDKNITDTYVYDEAYIDHLIEKLSTGEYDLDLLSDAEREQIESRLKQIGN